MTVFVLVLHILEMDRILDFTVDGSLVTVEFDFQFTSRTQGKDSSSGLYVANIAIAIVDVYIHLFMHRHCHKPPW